MSEREIRDAIQKVCGDLDLKARRGGWRRVAPALIPFAVGAGLAATGCDDETDTTPSGTDTGAQTAYGVPTGTPTGVGASGSGGDGAGAVGGGGEGGAAVGGGGVGGAGGEPTMEYMAPDP